MDPASALRKLWQKDGVLKAVGRWSLGMGDWISPVASGMTEPDISSFIEKWDKERKAEAKEDVT